MFRIILRHFVLSGLFLCLLANGTTAWSADLVVNTLDDPGLVGDGNCSLREAIGNADANSDSSGGDCAAGSGADTITVQVSGIVTLSSTLPNITDGSGLTIDGSGQAVTVSGNHAVRVLSVDAGASLSLRHLTVAEGSIPSSSSPTFGGGIYNLGSLSIADVTLSGNHAPDGGGIFSSGTLVIADSVFANNHVLPGEAGGGIYNTGNLTVTHSTFSANMGPIANRGGGIFNIGAASIADSTFTDGHAEEGAGVYNSGALTVTRSSFTKGSGAKGAGIFNQGTLDVLASTFFNNSASLLGAGGAIFTRVAPATVSNSTFSGNSADGEGGGGIYVDQSALTVKNSTFFGNRAVRHGSSWPTLGSGIASDGGDLTLVNTIIAGSPGPDVPDCLNTGTLTAVGVSIIGDGSCGAGSDPAHFLIEDPLLGPLADNGGPTFTHALLTGSPAIDAAENGSCAAAPVNNLDQRGVPRPLDGNGDGSAVCDIGSYEWQPAADACTTAGVLDDFNRRDGRLGRNWRGATGSNSYRIHSSQLDVRHGGPVYWDPDRFGVDQAAFVTFSRLDPLARYQGTLLKVREGRGFLAGPLGNVAVTSAISVTYDARVAAVKVSTLRPGLLNWRSYGTTPVAFTDGDKLGGCVLASGDVRVYKNDALVATVHLTPGDRAYFARKRGKIGLLELVAPQAVVDDFGGGTIIP